MARLGFIIGFLALIGASLSGLAAYRVYDQEQAIDRIALARAIKVAASGVLSLPIRSCTEVAIISSSPYLALGLACMIRRDQRTS